jgi:ABC-type transport system involved in cytochrome c biogenesis permease component
MSGARLGVRIAITSFIVLLIVIVTLGMSWASTHQPPPLRTASQIVLGAAGLAGVLAIARIWRADPPRSRPS